MLKGLLAGLLLLAMSLGLAEAAPKYQPSQQALVALLPARWLQHLYPSCCHLHRGDGSASGGLQSV